MGKSPEAFRTISEVSEWLDTPAHVLRFWESKFAQIKPVKRAGGRRYYRPEDMALLGGIKVLLHDQGMTIKGVQKLLREKGGRHVASMGPQPLDGPGGEYIDLAPDDDLTALSGPEGDSADDAPAAEWTESATMTAPEPAPRPGSAPVTMLAPAAAPIAPVSRVNAPRALPVDPPHRPAQARPGALSLIRQADPRRLRAEQHRIAPLLAQLRDLAGRMAKD